MKHQRHFESAAEAALREAELIRTMIADLDRGVQILDCDIATEQEHIRAFDRSDATSVLTRALEARRNNIKATVVALKRASPENHCDPPASGAHRRCLGFPGNACWRMPSRRQ